MTRTIVNIFMVLALIGCASELPPFPPALIPHNPSASEWPDAGAAILDDIRTLEYRESSAGDRQRLIAVLVHRVRYKVLSPRGLRHATMILPVDGYSSITKVAGRSVHPSGREIYLRQVDIVPRDNRGRRIPVGSVGQAAAPALEPACSRVACGSYECPAPFTLKVAQPQLFKRMNREQISKQRNYYSQVSPLTPTSLNGF